MALSYAFRQARKRQRRRSRRIQVSVFFMFMLLGLTYGGRPLTWENAGILLPPYFWALILVFSSWRQQRLVPVSSLDERAVVEHGVEFERLGDTEQKELLNRYRVGTYLLGNLPDERDGVQEREARHEAYEVMRWLLPLLAVIYWAGWRLLPEGRVRECWTDGPVVLAWVLLLVLALPQILQMWTEPDVVGEPKLVSAEREA
jgi:hypothetical protein